MDKNSIAGLLLIGAILLGYTWYMAPTEVEKAAYQHKLDSIEVVQNELLIAEKLGSSTAEIAQNSSEVANTALAQNDSVLQVQNASKFGAFASSAIGESNYTTIENELIKATVSTEGGRLVTVELKDYKTFKQEPLLLFDEDSSKFNLNFYSNSKYISTDELFFEPTSSSVEVSGTDEEELKMRLYAGSENKYIEYIYSLKGNSYVIDYSVNFVGLDELLAENRSEFGIHWSINGLNNEKNIDTERNTSSIFYKYAEEDVDWLSETSDDEGKVEGKLQWLSFKQQFFSTVIMCETGFEKNNSDMKVTSLEGSSKYTKNFEANLMLPFARGESSSEVISFYLGPNHYQTLEDVGMGLQSQINLGWGIFGWVNEYAIIPVFNFLDGFGWNYGIIILVLTVLIKMILFPITYKNYLSSAKMRVLKPEIDELNEKNKDADAMKKQQATMSLYKKAGVNPMAGCLPSLIQMPILYAMFRFFPASIELRQEAFLWADDLSTYDSIFYFGDYFTIPMYGDHISLFTILMAISMYFYTKVSGQSSMGGSGAQAQQMKMMMNMMPFMMLIFFNNYSAGLSYYYLLANCVTIGQQLAIKKWFINEDKIHAQIQVNKTKPVKKSNFQKRLDDMQKKQLRK
jgi:YidC/Oxa1 family membrane protein insertase